MNLKEENKDEMNYFSEQLRFENLKDIELLEIKLKINNAIEYIKSKSKILENMLLINKTIAFIEEDSEQLGHLIVNHKFDQFEITEDSCKLIKTIIGHTDKVTFIEQLEDFSRIVTSSMGKSIKIWSTESGECLKTLTGHTAPITSLVISNDKNYLISVSRYKDINIWNIEKDFECVKTLKEKNGVNSLCTLSNNILVCALNDGTIKKLNMNNFTDIDSFEAHKEYILVIKHVVSSQIVSCSGDNTIKLWNLETNEWMRTFIGHKKRIRCLEISFDKSKIYSSGRCDSLRVWDIYSGECLKIIDIDSPIRCLKLMSAKFLACGYYYGIVIIDLKSCETVRILKTDEHVRSLNFDADNNVMYCASEEPVGYQMWQF
jgi:WD40 repeat protein